MAKKLLMFTVKGNQSSYGFTTMADPAYIDEWRADGVEVYEVANIVPAWIVAIGLANVYCFAQDLFNFKNPFGR